MKFINEGSKAKDASGNEVIVKTSVTVADLGIFNIKFGETCDVPEGYAWPERASNGDRRPSVIEKMAPQLKPADLKEREVWMKVPQPGRKDGFRETPVPSVESLVKQGFPSGIAEQMHMKAASERDAERKQRREKLSAT